MTFTLGDLAGTWYFQVFADSPSTNAPYWVLRDHNVDASGAVTGGTAINDHGVTKTLTGGTLAIDADGQVAGSVTLSDGVTENLPR